MNILLEYKQIAASVEIFFDKTCPKSVSELRLQALGHLNGIVTEYSRKNILPSLIETIWDKKMSFIMSATTKSEIASILKPSFPQYNYGEWLPCSQYHVDEEEVLLWALFTPNHNVTDAAKDRYISVFKKCLPDTAKNIGL